jgi:hypothetical protein
MKRWVGFYFCAPFLSPFALPLSDCDWTDLSCSLPVRLLLFISFFLFSVFSTMDPHHSGAVAPAPREPAAPTEPKKRRDPNAPKAVCNAYMICQTAKGAHAAGRMQQVQ